jgi:hypothetical protein
MKEFHKFTYVLLPFVVVVGTALAFSGDTRTSLQASPQNQDQDKWKAREEEKKKHFPTAEFNEAAPTDPLKRARRNKDRNARMA